MPQLSLYIDEKTLRELETAAKIEKSSISKYVVKKLQESMRGQWPENFDSLFGSINDESFVIDKNLNFNNDTPREKL